MSAVRRVGAALWIAWSFLTVLPPPYPRSLVAEELTWALACFPLVGGFVGAASGLAVYVASRVFPHPLVAAIAVAAPLALTGALHFDGLLDTSDGTFAPRAADRAHDVPSGRLTSVGVATGGLTLLAFYACALSLDPLRLAFALTVAGAAGRAAALFAVIGLPHGRKHGLGRGMHARATYAAVATGLLLAIAIAAPAGMRGLIALIAALLVGRMLADLVAHRHGGSFTGDAYGFCEQFAELAVLLVFAIQIEPTGILP